MHSVPSSPVEVRGQLAVASSHLCRELQRLTLGLVESAPLLAHDPFVTQGRGTGSDIVPHIFNPSALGKQRGRYL